MKKWNWKNLLPPPMLVALLFASCNLIQEMPQDFVETYGNIAYVEKVDYVGLAEDVENGKPAKVTQTKNFKIIYSIRNDGNFDLSPEFTFEGCQIKNPHVDTEKKRVSLTVPGEELKALADGADFKVKLTLYKASQKVLQSAYELGMRYVRTDEPETPKFPVEIPIPGLKLPDGYTLSVKDSTEFRAEKDENGSWIITTIGSGVSEDKYTLELVVKDKDGNPLKDENGNEITIDKTIEVSAGGTTSGFTEKDDEKSFDEFIKEVEEKIKENETNPPEESKNPPTPETPKGTVEIKIPVPAGYELEIGGDDEDKFEVKKGEDGSYTIVAKEEGGLPEGKYELELVVKDKETSEKTPIGTKEIEVSGGEITGGFTGEPDDKPFEITTETIEDKKKDVVYVRGADGCYASKYPDAKEGDDVNNSGTLLSPFATIQKAIDTVIERNKQDEAANPNSYTIYIDGTLTQTAAPSDNKKGMADFSALGEDLKLTIRALPGTDPNETQKATLNANQKSRVMYAKPNSGKLDLTLENLIITGGNASSDNGGGIYFDDSDGTLKMEGCTVKGSEATNGGGIYLNSGTLELKDCTVGGENESDKNDAATGAGIYVADGTNKFEMTGGEISKNKATSVGGGIYITGSKEAKISGTTISGNTATTDGGGIYITGCTLTMDGTINRNTAKQGGGVYVADIDGVFTMTGGEISGNYATSANDGNKDELSGGGIFIFNRGLANISNTKISGNTAKNNGGGIHINIGTLNIDSGAIISKNTAQQDGGGVYVSSGTFNMNNGTIGGENGANTAQNGGGVRVDSGASFTMSGGTITENKVTGDNGGGVYLNGGTFTMNDGTISGNKAAFGGGVQINNDGVFTMINGTISENNANGNGTVGGGGGVHIYKGTFNMSGGTISGNKCTINTEGSGGGGVYVYTDQKFTMSGTAKISGNTAAKDGGGVYSNNGIFEMTGGTIGGTTSDKNTAEYGGGVYLMAGANTFTMSGGEISGNTANVQGGGVYVNSTNFSMSGTAKVNGNIATDSGGGIYLYKNTADAKFVMACSDEGEISRNTATNVGGGGIYNQDGDATIHSGTISGNKATKSNGGGVYNKNGTFTMNGGTIGGDTTSDKNEAQYGGGVYDYGGTFTMCNGEIINNKGTYGGGGLYLNTGSFKMEGGTFSGNSANIGKGAYIGTASGTFEMKGDANFNKDNDVYLSGSKTIKIADTLNKDYVATITPSAYTENSQVLSGTINQTVCDKFAVTPQVDASNKTTKWKVVADAGKGVLKKDNVDVGGSGGISVTIPGVGSYTFKFEAGSTEILEGSQLSSGTSIKFSEVKDSSGKALTSSDGTFSIEIRDEGGNTLTSATGFQCAVAVPVVPPIGMKLQIYAKVVLTGGGIVIDKTISVIGPKS